MLTWNIRHGVREAGKLDLVRIAKIITAQQPDIVVLQEVDKNCTRSGQVDEAAELARLTQMKFVFGKAMDLQGGEYGQAILTKEEPANLKVHPLPSSGEPRSAVSITLKTSLGQITVASVHLDYADEARQLAQAQVCAAALLASPNPVILAGDLNSKPDSRTVANFAQAPWTIMPKETSAATFPAAAPTSESDYIILRGLQAAKPATVVAATTGSDHRPVLGVVALPK
ncbi:MAG: hypothetical protein RLZZ522_1135 [Verrucomicrobiota bacterium]